jgi:hypothetical protein
MFRKQRQTVPENVRSQFLHGCKPQRGNANPEVISNDVWSWLVETELWPHSACQAIGIKKKLSPIWCFSRYGQSETLLPDGSSLFVGGEHEDFYDEDFYIYNDIIVKSLEGHISIYGYPSDVFEPTDFHSATIVDDKIYIIGCLGYAGERDEKTTPVYIVSLTDFAIHQLELSGVSPTRLHKHNAALSEERNAIILTDGMVIDTTTGELQKNTTCWRICLNSNAWQNDEE